MRLDLGPVLFLVAALASSSTVAEDDWLKPRFLEPEPLIPEIKFSMEGDYEIYQTIEMDEEVPADENDPVLLAKLNYFGESTPLVTALVSSGASYRRVDGDHYIVVTKRHDYDTMPLTKFSIDVEIDGQEGTIFLNIQNIDDNAPIVEIRPCSIPELYVGPSNCTYNVFDADGALSTSDMTFFIEGSDEDVEIFFIEQKPTDSEYDLLIRLHTALELDFFKSQIHIFTIVAIDPGRNNGNASAIVQVVDVPNMPPMWTQVFAIQTFDEKTEREFRTKAVDGDTQINTEINYRLETDMPELFSIDEKEGILRVAPIDRDTLKREVFNLDMIAYKANNVSSQQATGVVIIVNDVNDHSPTVGSEEFSITVPEESYVSLDFDPAIVIEDVDLGTNAQYGVKLRSVSPPGAKDAFMVVPNEGYQKQTFQITIMNASLLDYDTEGWEVVKIEIVATELYEQSHTGSALVTINLINWNDELPIFLEDSVVVRFNETVEKGFRVATLTAKDRDVGDAVVHSLVGGAGGYLSIDSETGEIVVGKDDAFDYQRQSEIMVQVKAEDTLGYPYHAAYAQLTIQLVDVNNKPPEIRMPRTTPSVDENVPEGYVITNEIIGSDPDSSAFVVFSIDWDESYATKQGRPTPAIEYRGCVEIATEYTEGTRVARGVIEAKEIRHNVTIDFEQFEVLYLAVVLTDTEQEIGDGVATGTLTITIVDLNDNAPKWTTGSLETLRFVREAAPADAVIGSVLATDDDGPEFNKVTYRMTPAEETSEGLVKIDKTTGLITVDADEAIDADIPLYFLYYNITATDCEGLDPGTPCFDTVGSIEISITDTNNKDPHALEEQFMTTVEVYEHEPSGTLIECVKSEDFDRDEMYHNVSYKIDHQRDEELRKFFDIDFYDGCLYVKYTTEEELDWDLNDDPFYTVYVNLADNYNLLGDRVVRTNTTEIRIVLLDINDNAPQLPPPSAASWKVSEKEISGFRILPNVTAPDIDDPSTDNAKVRYRVLSLEIADPPGKNFTENMIDIESPDNVSGILFATEDLKGFWGSYKIELMAIDHGVPPLNTTETYDLTVTPYNYAAPRIIFPADGVQLRLARESAFVGVNLMYANLSVLDVFSAVDDDGLDAGVVTFRVFAPDEAVRTFTLVDLGDNKAQLRLLEKIEDKREFEISVVATDKGTDPGPLNSTVRFSVSFVSTTGNPTFANKTETVKFKELDETLEESFRLQRAKDDKNDGCEPSECYDIFYHLTEGDAELFALDPKTNELGLRKPLNRTEQQSYVLKIVASNFPSKPEVVQEDSVLTVTVKVREANPRPVFASPLYAAGVSVADNFGKLLFTLKADHTEELPIAYAILTDTIEADESLESVKEDGFDLNESTGDLKLNFKPRASMRGMLEFSVSATDTDGAADETEVKVYIIAENIKIMFSFNNNVQEVEQKENIVASVLTKTFGYTCHIDEVLEAEEDGAPLEDKTQVLVYFIDENLPVQPEVIEEKKADMLLMKAMEAEFQRQGLSLEGFSSSNPGPSPTESAEKMLKIALIVVSTVLTVMCLALLLAYYFRTKSLSARLKDISEVNFGAVEPDANGYGVGAGVPGTNKHAIEGSNPVWNDDKTADNLDAVSDASGDSDLVGIEDDPQFRYS